MTKILKANGFGTSEALQLGLQHGPFPEFKQVSPYPEALAGKVPVDSLAHQLGLPRDPQALLAAYASALRDHCHLSRFDAVTGALPEPDRPWAAHVPGADAVRWMQSYAAIPLPQRIDFVPLRSLPWDERYAVRSGHGPAEHVYLFFGEPTPGTQPEQVGHELTRGLLYHVLGGAVSRLMEPHRQTVNESGQQLYRLVESWVDPGVRALRLVLPRAPLYDLRLYLTPVRPAGPGDFTRPRRLPAGNVVSAHVLVLRPGGCGRARRVVRRGRRGDPGRDRPADRPGAPAGRMGGTAAIPGRLRNCFVPYWLRRKTLAAVPRSGMTTSDVQRLVASHWGRNFPVVQADQWSPQRHGSCNLILFGRPDQSPPLAEWFERNGRQPAGDMQLSLGEHLRRGTRRWPPAPAPGRAKPGSTYMPVRSRRRSRPTSRPPGPSASS